MTTTSKSSSPRLKYHPAAYQFVDAALRHTQNSVGRTASLGSDEEDAHISGQELLQGIRELAVKQFGLMTVTVFHQWGVHTTDDFGRIVFEFIERGAMRKTDRDQLSDFFEVYEFADVFDRQYQIDTSNAFQRGS